MPNTNKKDGNEIARTKKKNEKDTKTEDTSSERQPHHPFQIVICEASQTDNLQCTKWQFYRHFEMCSIVEIEHMSWKHKIYNKTNLIHAAVISNPIQSNSNERVVMYKGTKYIFSFCSSSQFIQKKKERIPCTQRRRLSVSPTHTDANLFLRNPIIFLKSLTISTHLYLISTTFSHYTEKKYSARFAKSF